MIKVSFLCNSAVTRQTIFSPKIIHHNLQQKVYIIYHYNKSNIQIMANIAGAKRPANNSFFKITPRQPCSNIVSTRGTKHFSIYYEKRIMERPQVLKFKDPQFYSSVTRCLFRKFRNTQLTFNFSLIYFRSRICA